MACPHAQIDKTDLPDGTTYIRLSCAVINSLIGINCTMEGESCYLQCKYSKGDDSFVREMAKGHLCNLLITGNQPRFPMILDIPALAARFKPISSTAERKEVVRKAVVCQCIPQEKGGHDATTIEKNLKELERELDVPGTLERAL